jgi:hypothetical protein
MKKSKYSVYQLKKTDDGMKLLHLTFEQAKSRINAKNYEKVWSDEIEYNDNEEPWRKVAASLGKDLPIGFYGHMISVSDVITIDDEAAYYVDATGYQKLNDEFLANI